MQLESISFETSTKYTILKNFLKEKTNHPMGGVQIVFAFPNNYGASVIRGPFSYGGNQGYWELAVLDKNGEICYDTEVTDDVIGYLTEEQVLDVLYHIYCL